MSASESTCSHDCRTANWSRYTGKENGEKYMIKIAIVEDEAMYAKQLEEDYDEVLCYGISFFKKRCMVKK